MQIGGAVTQSCINQLQALAVQHPCVLLTDAPARQADHAFSVQDVWVPELRWLHRYAHVPRQMLFLLQTGIYFCLSREARRTDLVIFHSHPPTALLTPILHRVLHCKVVMVVHGDIRDRPPGTYDPRLTWWYAINTLPAYRRADAIIALSPYMANLAYGGGAQPSKVHLAPNGVDAEEIGLTAHDIKGTTTCNELLFVGRLEFNKGIDLLIDAFRTLAPLYPELRLTCIGSANTAIMESLLDQLRQDQLIERLRLLPQQPREQLGQHYQSASLVIVPSRSEPQSTVTMEAMAAGRAVIASNTGGNPMLVDPGKSGLLFRNGDRTDLIEQLDNLLATPATLQAMGQAALDRHRSLFSRARVAEAFVDCIDNL